MGKVGKWGGKNRKCYIHKALTWSDKHKSWGLRVWPNSCIVYERPKGHKKHYPYLYSRFGRKLVKKYIGFLNDGEIKHVKWCIAEMKRRNARNKMELDALEGELKARGLI